MRKFLVLAVSLLLISGCGSSPDLVGAGNGVGFVAQPANNSNVIRAEQFSLAAGETLNLTEDTTILANDTLNINGQVNLQPGVNLTLFAANQLTVSGQIGPSAQVLTRQASSGTSSTGIRAQGGEAPGAVALVSPDQVISGSITGAPGQDIFVAAISPSGGIATRVNITGTLIGGVGADSSARDTPGEKGGNVIIGGQAANAAALDLLGETPDSAVASQLGPIGRLTVTGTVRGGTGGAGFNDLTGTPGPDTGLEFMGGRGGLGGDVILTADDYSLQGVEGGTGGNGGNCGPGRGADAHVNNQGQDVFSRPGAGGSGGDVTVVESVLPLPQTIIPGLGGRPGNSLVAAGNGGVGEDGGEGGNTVIVPNIPGLSGAVTPLTASVAPRVNRSTFVVVIENGGMGGTSTNPLLPGGRGGDVRLDLPSQFTTAGSNRSALDMTIRNYGNGGRGGDACDTALTETAGVGGPGGRLFVGEPGDDLAGDETFAPKLLIENSFRAGNNGNGEQGTPTPGSGGPDQIPTFEGNPTPITIVESFVDGLVGGPCPIIAFEADVDPNTPGLQTSFVFQFDENDSGCGTLPDMIFRAHGEGESLPLDYTLTPMPPAPGSGGVTIPSTSGSLQPGQSVEMTPTFDCNSDSISQIWNLRVQATNSQGEDIENIYIIEYSGTKVSNPVVGFVNTWAQIVSTDNLTDAQALYVPDFRYNGLNVEGILGFAPGADVDISDVRVVAIGDPDPNFNDAVPVWVDFRRTFNSAGPPSVQFTEDHKAVFRLVPSTGVHPWAVVTQQSLEREVAGTFVDGTGAVPAPNPQPPNFGSFQFIGPLGPVAQGQTLQVGDQMSADCELNNFLPAGLADFTFLGFPRQLSPLGGNNFGTSTFNVTSAIPGHYLAEFYAENGVETLSGTGFAFSYSATARTIEIFIPPSF